MTVFQLQFQTNSVHLSEESTSSVISMPPTPGKHLFGPPPPAHTISPAGSSSQSESGLMQGPTGVPPKKRKKQDLSEKVCFLFFLFCFVY